MDAVVASQRRSAVRVLYHIKRLDDCFSDFLVRVVCECGACREIPPQALGRLVGRKVTLKNLAPRIAVFEVRQGGCRGGGRCEAEAAYLRH
jgi:hypothetical protein